MNLEQITEAGVSRFRVPQWEADGFLHGFLGRSFDLKVDPAAAVSHIGAVAKQQIAASDGVALHLLKQTHSDIVREPGGESTASGAKEEGDGWLISLSPRNTSAPAPLPVFGILTADCAPVIVLAKDHSIAAILHCGWRGAVLGILERALRAFAARGAPPSSVEIAIGPCALSCCYEVSEAFPDEARKVNPRCDVQLERREGRFFFDLPALLRRSAISIGVQKQSIFSSAHCTIDSLEYFSFRREKELAGRQLSFISPPRDAENLQSF